MTVNNEDRATIAQHDPFSVESPHLDFKRLRREGLEHIGKLSGRIWTDHNAHDPGVTILEALCYALIDLGYRTTLPIEDLLAEPQDDSVAGSEDTSENFFTPHEILSCNPTTISDYRKLLLEVDGVRNAWLQPADVNACSIELNGLYSILVQKEKAADKDKVTRSVIKLLSAHRNLCEDFESITMLHSQNVGICADVEIEDVVNPAAVYEDLITAVKLYISPEVQYYTLEELLDKGKAIEDVFAGRPLLNLHNNSRSVGFVDIDELESMPFRESLHGSDLYATLLDVDGVIAVRGLSFQPERSEVEGNEAIPTITVEQGCIAEFSLEQTCISLQSSQRAISLNKERVHRRLQQNSKPSYSAKHLDLPIPKGRHRPELAEYYSIQHDFPLVYGIGEGGLSDDEPLPRKVQAMQLKGYLLFYDQLLANYLAQVGNLSHLFSLREESKRPASKKHTYFSQALGSVPDQERLFPRHPGKVLTTESIMATPVVNGAVLTNKLEALKNSPLIELRVTDSCAPQVDEISHFAVVSKSLLDVQIRQSIRDFHQSEYSQEIYRDRNGYLFVISFMQACDLALISHHRYKTQDEAREAANFAAFLAAQPEYYSKKSQQIKSGDGGIQYQYNLAYDPTAYAAYLQFLVEDEALYLQRRESFLDHLLVRFAVQFTDYVQLQLGSEGIGKSEHRKTVQDKSVFLSQIDDLSRDRGRASNYLEPAWGTDNVSGFEKRTALLAGIQHTKRHHLSKFEVVESFRVEIKDSSGKPWLSSIETCRTREELDTEKAKLFEKLSSPDAYDELRQSIRGLEPVPVRRIFSHELNEDENRQPSTWVYSLILKNSRHPQLQESIKRDYAKPPLNPRSLNKFIREISDDRAMALIDIGAEDQLHRLYIDDQQVRCRLDPIITYKWHRYDFQGKLIESASEQYPSLDSAVTDFSINGDHAALIIPKTDVTQWSLNLGDDYPPLLSIHAFDNELEAQRAWLRCKDDGQNKQQYRVGSEPEGVRITLMTEEGFELASATISEPANFQADEYVALCIAGFAKNTVKLKFPVLPRAYGWRLASPVEGVSSGGGIVLESTLLFSDIPSALTALMDALVAAKQVRNYFEAGTEDNPDYRILLRLSKEGPFVATTLGYTSAVERKKNLKIVQRQMKKLSPPLTVTEEPRLYRWELVQTGDEALLLASNPDKAFDTEQIAKENFEDTLRKVYAEQPLSPVGQQVYTIELKETEDKYRFIYCENDSDGNALPLLRSEDEFNAEELTHKYAEFVAALPTMELEVQEGIGRVSSTEAVSAVLVEDTEESRSKVKDFLGYMSKSHEKTTSENDQSKWIYRLLDRDNPIAKSKLSYHCKDDAKTAMQSLCQYKPCSLPLKKGLCPKPDIVRVICPALVSDRFHYALFLGTKNKDGTECATLISYVGYASEDAAREAGEQNWLKLIELATDSDNYGDGKLIAEKEVYSDSISPDCDNAGAYLAVKPESIETDEAIACARCYPIRISYKTDQRGKYTQEQIGFHFLGYDPKICPYVWRSAVDYPEVDQALEAYQRFLTILGNADSCRLECEDGCYRIHLIEILAESRECLTEAEAWGDLKETIEGENARFCTAEGVRLFSQTATAEESFIPVRDGDCYHFDVVAKGYSLAAHTCDYASREERDKAKEALYHYAREALKEKAIQGFKAGGLKVFRSAKIESESSVDSGDFLNVKLCDKYVMQSLKKIPKQRASDDQELVDEWLWFASSRRNGQWIEDKSAGQWVLANPFENDVAVASIECTEKQGQFDPEAFQQAVQAYPVFRKANQYRFRFYYPKNRHCLDEQLSIFGCGEPNQEENQTELPFCGQPYVYESIESYPSRVTAEKAYERFLELLTCIDNYSVEEETGIGPFSFSIIDPEKVIASHPHSHPDRTSAMRAEERVRACVADEGMHLLEHILLRPGNDCDCLLPLAPDEACELKWQEGLDAGTEEGDNSDLSYIPGADPYSFWATVVLPAWSERFNNAERRHLFRQMLYREVPAMVGLNIVWLSPRQMHDFERVFKTWLSSRQYPPATCGEDDPFCDMVNCIKMLKNDPPCQDAESSALGCDCLTGEVETKDPCIEWTESLFWSDDDQVSEEVKERLIEREEIQPSVVTGPADDATVRKALHERSDGYNKNYNDIKYALTKKTKSYKQAGHFLENSPTMGAFKSLTAQMTKDISRKGTKKGEKLIIAFSNAFWYFLDHLLQAQPTAIAPEASEILPQLLRDMTKEGLDIDSLATDWHGEIFADLFGPDTTKVVNAYLALIREC